MLSWCRSVFFIQQFPKSEEKWHFYWPQVAANMLFEQVSIWNLGAESHPVTSIPSLRALQSQQAASMETLITPPLSSCPSLQFVTQLFLSFHSALHSFMRIHPLALFSFSIIFFTLLTFIFSPASLRLVVILFVGSAKQFCELTNS